MFGGGVDRETFEAMERVYGRSEEWDFNVTLPPELQLMLWPVAVDRDPRWSPRR